MRPAPPRESRTAGSCPLPLRYFLAKLLCDQNSSAHRRDLRDVIFVDSYQLINIRFSFVRGSLTSLLKGSFLFFPPCNVVMVNSLKADIECSCVQPFFLSQSLLAVGERRGIWVDFRKERKLSNAVECKAEGGGSRDRRKSVEEVGGVG